MNFKLKITAYYILVILCIIIFNCYVFYNFKNILLLNATLLFCFIFLILSIIFISILKTHIENILNQLSHVISQISDIEEKEIFSVLDDNILSKLQTQVIRLANLLKKQNLKIKLERDEIKSLISDICHQLITPLSNLKIYYELLQDPSISRKDYLEFMRNTGNQIDKLSFLFESMIKLSRLESGIIKLIPSKINLSELCLIAINQAYQKAKKKNIEIIFESKKDIILTADKNWTAEAIFNIIDNAIKYTKKNGIICIKVKKYEMFSRIDIADNGIGIAEKEINNIFKRFYRIERDYSENGVGIGLYISRYIISKQNGYIKVKSKLSNGSLFSIFLPLN